MGIERFQGLTIMERAAWRGDTNDTCVKLRRLVVIICSTIYHGYRDLGDTGIVTSVSTVSIEVSWVSHNTS